MRSALFLSALLLTVSLSACIESDGDGGGNSPPKAVIRWEGSNKAGMLIYFFSDRCSDPDGDALEYIWDFGDGSPTWPARTTRVYHRYQEVGTYTVTLIVSDRKATDTTTEEIEIGESPNQRPSAEIEDVGMVFLEDSGEVTVRFDASDSSDPDDGVLSYFWDFDDRVDEDNDSIPNNDLEEDDATAYHTYNGTGDLNVTLVVTDGELNDTAVAFVMVRWPTPTVDFDQVTNHGVTGWEIWVANHSRAEPIGSFHYWIIRGMQTVANGTLTELGDGDVLCRDDDGDNNLTDGDNIFIAAGAAEVNDVFLLSYIPNEIEGEWHGGDEAEVAEAVLPE